MDELIWLLRNWNADAQDVAAEWIASRIACDSRYMRLITGERARMAMRLSDRINALDLTSHDILSFIDAFPRHADMLMAALDDAEKQARLIQAL